MLRELVSAFLRKDVVQELSVQIGEMIDGGAWMFETVGNVLERKVAPDEVADALYQRDRKVNKAEQAIRERIVTHLSSGSNVGDLGPCLALMSVVKDAERVGDYCKNIFEVGKYYRGPFRHDEYRQPLLEMHGRIAEIFPLVRLAIVESDPDAAKKVRAVAEGLEKQADMMVSQLLAVPDEFAGPEAAAYALVARYYKRIEAHLSNLATSVITPIPMLDFHAKPKESKDIEGSAG